VYSTIKILGLSLNFGQFDKPVASKLRSLAAGFADACIEKAAAKSAPAGKKLCALRGLCGYILRALRAFVVKKSTKTGHT